MLEERRAALVTNLPVRAMSLSLGLLTLSTPRPRQMELCYGLS